MNWLVKLKLFDPDQTLSLTNLMMLVLIVKVAIASSLDLEIVAALFLSLASYNIKKWFAKNKADGEREVVAQDENTKAEFDAIRGELRTLTQIINLRK
jgi:hypothetical protein